MPIIIDGYNLLRSVQRIEEYQSLDEAALCRIISEYLLRVRTYAHVVFDGIGPPDKSELSGIDNLEVYFSGEHLEADDVIEEKIEEYSAPKNMIVVSTDRRIRAAAAKRKSVSVTSDLFWLSLIEQLDKKKPTPMPKEKRHGITESEADAWMDEFDLE
jgi:predicted RNA-binding protein with PIN domain